MSILELIDNALDGATSGDAMRWTPDPAPLPTTVDARRDMFWRKVWWKADHGGQCRAWGLCRWHRRLYRLPRCGDPGCYCCGAATWLATVYVETTTAVSG